MVGAGMRVGRRAVGITFKWLMTLVAGALAFVASFSSAVLVASWVVPEVAEGDRWVAAAAFATVLSTAVGAWTAWWAGLAGSRDPHPGHGTAAGDLTDEGLAALPAPSVQGSTAIGSRYTNSAGTIVGLQQGDGNTQHVHPGQ
jgi:hypothetical protein